jgi:hypothetical protein
LERPRKSWKTNAFFLIVLWLILLIASLTILSSVVTPFLKTLQTQNLVSFDWGGYGVASNTLFPMPLVVSVNGSWTVPTVPVSDIDTFSAAWIGIGGQGDPTLIQVGSQQDSVNGRLDYSLWYEMLPADSISIPNIAVSPGDKIAASITLVNSGTNEWLIEISDVTTGKGFSQSFQYNSSRLSAEWIIERPTVNNQLATLANFGSITFTDVNVQIGSNTGNIKSFPNYNIVMEDRQNNQLVKLSDFSPDGSSFTITYI